MQHARKDRRRAIDTGLESGDRAHAVRDALLDRERVFAGLRHATVGQTAQPAVVQPGIEQRSSGASGGIGSQGRHRPKITERAQK
jgi:hypothetical protein